MCENYRRPIFVTAIFCLLYYSFVNGVKSPYFLFLHDEYFPFPGHEIAQSFYVYSYADMGVSNTLSLIVTIFDRIYYFTAYTAGFSIFSAQFLLYGLKLALILILPYFGFQKIASNFCKKTDYDLILVVSLWYSCNTFTLIYWHGNAFSLTLLICYAIAPITFSFWDEYILNNKYNKKIEIIGFLKLGLLLFIMSFALYLFAAFILMLVIYSALSLLLGIVNITELLKRSIILLVICMPLCAVQAFTLYDLFYLSVGAQNSIGGATNSNLQGGFLYMSFMWFTWAIYHHWTPRNVYTFSEYFNRLVSIIAPFFLYLLIFFGSIKFRRNLKLTVFIILLLFFWLISKGPQEPFGFLYNYLLNNVPGFRVFRSPDTKFGFTVVFLIAMLLVVVADKLNKRVFIFLIAFVLTVQAWPLLTGIAIKGENSPNSFDRIITVPAEYKEVAKYINDRSNKFGYIFVSPGDDFAAFNLPGNEQHFGQDLLRKICNLPFIASSEYSGMPQESYQKLKYIQDSQSYGELRSMGIRYYLFRNDLGVGPKITEDTHSLKKYLIDNYDLVFENSIFMLYEDRGSSPFIDHSNSNFIINSPSRTTVEVDNNGFGGQLTQRLNFSPGWRMYYGQSNDEYPAGSLASIFQRWVDDIFFLFKKPAMHSEHILANGYANGWDLSKLDKEINPPHPDQKTTSVVLHYWPQSLFLFLLTISLFVFLIYIVIIFLNKNSNDQ